MKCGTILLMQLSSPSFTMKTHLEMSVWLVVTRLGRTVLWNLKPVLIIYVLQQNPKVHMNFSTGEYGLGVHHGFTWIFGQKILI